MHIDEFKDLLEKYLDDRISAEERRRLATALEDPACAQLLDETIYGELVARAYEGTPDEGIRQLIMQRLDQEAVPVRTIRLRKYRWAAAAAILALVAGTYFWLQRPAKHPAAQQTIANAIPGSNKAILTLSDGSIITLDSTGNQVIRQGATAIHQQGGQLKYDAQSPSAAVQYNTLATPRGGQFRVTLPDGTQVWLNAASTLRYPTAFTGPERLVEVNGEAYFEVAANAAQPFKVKIRNAEIQVLGTSFNVNAYADEPITQTTLLEGSIKLSANNNQVLLKPGQQATLAANRELHINEVNSNDAIAWKNGYFLFRNESIESVMRTIARWYDVDVSYQGDVMKQRLGGTVSRYEKLEDLLKTIELTKSLKFKIEGRKVTIMPN
ncbi:FecR domain-containing protein [Chitinophaga polysaccharea]|uniref:FecR domain-containing protein n=1 Tax=Chitinophaga polysaccharea TaxID=1293035 RepID=UPI00115BEF0B|nr:FecR domain-containing protein [Chitinophaga polysaccharea]